MRVAKTEPVAHLYTQYSELCLCLSLRAADHENEVSGLGFEPFCDAFQVVGSEELVDRRLERSVGVEFDVD